MLLSIIIPYYNVKEYTDALLLRLAPQITPEVEVILVDDASPEPYKTRFKWCKVVRHRKNKSCSGARNTGLDKAKGDYIQFIDADDMVPDYFISRLFQEIAENPFDVCDYSWKSLEGDVVNKLNSRDDRLHNPSVCTRCFSRAFIGSTRFNTKKDATEDEDFSRKAGYVAGLRECVRTAIPEFMYFYRMGVPGSKFKRYRAGLMNTKQIVYYYPAVTSDMTWLLDEIRKEDEVNEVWLLTNQCDIPELARYCRVRPPQSVFAHEARGEALNLIQVIHPPIRTQVVLYSEYASIGFGIPTFMYNFCVHMRKYYDILVLYKKMSPELVARFREIVQTEQERPDLNIVCDTLIHQRLTDALPACVTFKKSVQMVHACRLPEYHIPQERDVIVNVSEASRSTWGEESERGIVIHNLPRVSDKNALVLVSATRIGGDDKGGNDARMRTLAQMLTTAGIPFLWLCFSEKPLLDMPFGFVNMDLTVDVQPFIKRADYVVQLSDAEAYSYSILEALTNNVPVICTPFKSAWETGVVDGDTGHIVPFDMDFDVKTLLDVPKFTYHIDTEARIRQWRELLGNTKPKGGYKPPKMVKARVLTNYHDLDLERDLVTGAVVEMKVERVKMLSRRGLVEHA